MATTKTKTVTSKSKTAAENSSELLREMIEIARQFTAEIQDIMTADDLSVGEKGSILGGATRTFTEYIDDIESKHV
tara:strand:+ start:3266 stop:3493 length:228 start_codon:yes stop_codon:yes gene_type:complete